MTAVSSDTLAKLSREFLPIELSGDAIQYQVNRNAQGWVIELINNDGVYKTGDQPAKIYPQATASIRLKPRFRFQSAREWITRTTLKVDETGSIPLQIPLAKLASWPLRLSDTGGKVLFIHTSSINVISTGSEGRSGIVGFSALLFDSKKSPQRARSA